MAEKALGTLVREVYAQGAAAYRAAIAAQVLLHVVHVRHVAVMDAQEAVIGQLLLHFAQGFAHQDTPLSREVYAGVIALTLAADDVVGFHKVQPVYGAEGDALAFAHRCLQVLHQLAHAFFQGGQGMVTVAALGLHLLQCGQ